MLLQYKQPSNCERLCANEPCKLGSCVGGKQTAGFPLPILRDWAGSSPISGWGKIGLEDYFYPNVRVFLFNILFYSALLATLWIGLVLGKRLRSR